MFWGWVKVRFDSPISVTVSARVARSLPLAGPARGRGEESDPFAKLFVYAAALCRASSAWYSLNSSATALAMLGRARNRS
jgi:hypothetical protein